MDLIDVKPLLVAKQRGPTRYIVVHLIDDDYKLSYRCQKATQMSMLARGFAENRGIKHPDTIIFTHNNERVMPEVTMGELGFRYGDRKDMIFQSALLRPKKETNVEQGVKSEVKQKVKTEDSHISLKFIYNGDTEISFRMSKTAPFKKAMKVFCEKVGVQMGALIFLYDGVQMFAYGTPIDFDMEDGEIVEVFLGRTAGGADLRSGGLLPAVAFS